MSKPKSVRARVAEQEFAMMHWSLLAPHPENARDGDVGAITESIDQNDLYGAIVAQRATHEVTDASVAEFGHEAGSQVHHLLKGSHTFRAGRFSGIETFPVALVDKDDKEARRIVLVDNATSDRATYNNELHEALLTRVRSDFGSLGGSGYDDEDFNRLHEQNVRDALGLAALPEATDTAASTDDESDKPNDDPEDGEIFALREDVLFPSTNAWGLPDLDVDMLSEQVPRETWARGPDGVGERTMFIYGTGPFPAWSKGGVLAFYTEDYRFEKMWSNAVGAVEEHHDHEWGSIIAPDFSVWRDDPIAVQLWNTYRNRWCSRYWQKAGFRVIPGLKGHFAKETHEWLNAGIPRGCPLVSINCRTGTSSDTKRASWLRAVARGVEEVTPQAVMIYGGLDHRAWLETGLPRGVTYHYVESWTAARSRIRASRGAKPKRSA